MAGFDDVADPAATGGAFTGSQIGATLYGVSPVLAAIPIDIGKKKPAPGTPKVPSAGWATPMKPAVPGVGEVPDLVTLDKAAAHIFTTDVGDLSSLQKQMWDGGWYSNTTYKQGYTAGNIQSGDDTDQSWNSVVLTAAKQGKSVQEVLQDAIDRVNKAGGLDAIGKSSKAQSAPARPTAKVDLYHYGNAIARTLIGREMPREQMDKFIAQYQSQEQAGEAGSPEASAEAFLQNQDGAQVGAQRMVQAFGQLMQMVGQVKPVSLGG